MALKTDKKGNLVLTTGKDLDEAFDVLATLQQQLAELEQMMEEEYDYLTIREDIENTKEAIRVFMTEMDIANKEVEGGKWVLVKRSRSSWNADKLKKLVGKGKWLKITRQVVDSGKIDDLVRRGELDRKAIAPAFEQSPEKPHLRFYASSEDEAADEEARLKEAMGAS